MIHDDRLRRPPDLLACVRQPADEERVIATGEAVGVVDLRPRRRTTRRSRRRLLLAALSSRDPSGRSSWSNRRSTRPDTTQGYAWPMKRDTTGPPTAARSDSSYVRIRAPSHPCSGVSSSSMKTRRSEDLAWSSARFRAERSQDGSRSRTERAGASGTKLGHDRAGRPMRVVVHHEDVDEVALLVRRRHRLVTDGLGIEKREQYGQRTGPVEREDADDDPSIVAQHRLPIPKRPCRPEAVTPPAARRYGRAGERAEARISGVRRGGRSGQIR